MRKILYILLTLPLFAFGQVQDSCYSVTDFMSQTETVNPAITKNFTAGWNMFGYPCTQSLDLVEALSSIIDKVIIVKNNNGNVYMPEFGFNGIGYLESGEGYQIKLSDTEYGFSFCESINWPDIEGCTDCEAVNYNEVATTDNGSCQYIRCDNIYACNYLQLNTDCIYGSQDLHDIEFEMSFECDSSHPYIQQHIVSISDLTTLHNLYDNLIDELMSNKVDTETIDSISVIDTANTMCSIFPLFCETKTTTDELEKENLIYFLYSEQTMIHDNIYFIELYEIPEICADIQVLKNQLAYNMAVVKSENLVTYNMLGNCSYCSNKGENGFLIFDVDDDYDGICNSNEIYGCTNTLACNYSSIATQDDNSCEFADEFYDCNDSCINDSDSNNICDELQGCAEDEEACNFSMNPTLIEDCIYAEYGYNCDSTIYCQYIDPILTDQAIIDSFSTTSPFCKDYTNSRINGIHLMGWFMPSDNIQNLYGLYQIESVRSLWLSGMSNISSLEGLNNIESVELIQISNNSNLSDCSAIYPLLSIADSVSIINNAEGCNSVEEIEISYNTGCMDTIACNFDSSKLYHNESFCTYPEQGYDCDGNITAEIGDIMEGGYLFYLNETNTGGLVAAFDDIGAHEWGCHNENVQGADGIKIGTGLQNTLDVFNQNCVDENGEIAAAPRAFEYVSDNYSNWYLPSKNELIEMYNSIGQGSSNYNIGGFADTWYWSSSEINNMTAWYVSFGNFLISTGSKTYNDLVRPIRTFGNWTIGCMDSLACNYNPEANMADDSCTYPEQGYDCDGNITAEIGDEIEGGYLFYLDESGSRGLVAAMEDLEGKYEWGCYGSNPDGQFSELIGYGYSNSLYISQGCISEGGDITAAQAAINYNDNGYNDWYLPSLNELNTLYNSIGNTYSDSHYWSSNQVMSENGFSIYFGNGNYSGGSKFHYYNVLPIRSFGDWNEGCMDNSACNYNENDPINFHNSTLCEYPKLGYDCDGYVTAQIGDVMEGGYLFYVDSTGKHGLVAAMEDLDGSYEWGCFGESVNGADGFSIGTGYQNTMDIVNHGCTTENGSVTAAKAALDAEINNYDDWYLPSIDELWLVWNNLGQGSENGNIGGFSDYNYWSSTQVNGSDAKSINFGFGTSSLGTNKGSTNKVVPIRSF